MERTPEPELMNDDAQAAAYAAADFEAPHRRVVELFAETFPDAKLDSDVLDLGCGPGDIALRMARAYPACRVIGVDGAEAMLKCGRAILHKLPAELRSRVLLTHGLLPNLQFHGQTFDTVVSNSLLHHLHDPSVLWNTIKRFARPGARVFVVDLMRPRDAAEAQRLADLYTSGEPDVLRRDFHHSLHAAFTVEEVQAQLRTAGLEHLSVRAISDRHLMISGTMPATRRLRGVLFDLDGTLLDTLKDLADAVNRVVSARGFPTHNLDDFRWLVGEGARLLIERSLPEDHRDAATVESALTDYRADYSKHWNVSTRAYDGIPELLAELQRRGIALGVLSNKPHVMTQRCIEGYFPTTPFAAVLGQRDEVPRKPDPAGAYEAAAKMGMPAQDVLYVGDTAVDMQTARAAGMMAAGVTWGFRPESELRDNGAQIIVHHPRELLALFGA